MQTRRRHACVEEDSLEEILTFVKREPQKYRVVRSLLEEGDEEDPPSYLYTIREVFYREDGSVVAVSEETLPAGLTRSDLQEDLLRMINALIYPALDEDGEEIV